MDIYSITTYGIDRLPILHPIYKTTGRTTKRDSIASSTGGCGKTIIAANAIAGELKVPFISVSAPSVVSGMSGGIKRN